MKPHNPTRRAGFILLGLMAAVVVGMATSAAGLPQPAYMTAAIITLCAVWWVTEPIDLAATAIIPFALLPLAGIMDHKEVSSAYGNSIVLLLLSGFLLSKMLEDSGTHRRLALLMVRLVGGQSHRRLVLAFMLATAALSMWIANTAVALMMLPIVAAVYEGDEHASLAAPLLLGICYAANIGGMGTPIGTPPAVVFIAAYEETTGKTVSFVDWMKLGVPAVLILVPLAWVIVTRKLTTGTPVVLEDHGPWTRRQKLVLLIFVITALAWVTREGPAGGWTELLGMVDENGKSMVGDSTVGLFCVGLAFLIPGGEGRPLLSWDVAARIPWGLLVLVGGGIALARAFTSSGLSTSMEEAIAAVAGWPLIYTILTVCLLVSFMTELASNTATATLLMPVLAAAAIGVGVDPGMLMMPAVWSAACAFMLPVATGPNAVVYGSGRVSIAYMVKSGLLLNMVGVTVISILCFNLLPHILP